MPDLMLLARRWLPRPLRHALQRVVSLDGLKMRLRASASPLATVTFGDEDRTGAGIRVGIIANRASYHLHFVAACQEEGVPFRVVDLAAADWQGRVREAGCDLYLAWPDATPKLIHVKGTIDLNVDDNNSPLTCLNYYQPDPATGEMYSLHAFLAMYEPAGPLGRDKMDRE